MAQSSAFSETTCQRKAVRKPRASKGSTMYLDRGCPRLVKKKCALTWVERVVFQMGETPPLVQGESKDSKLRF